jgi:hypothetical protein
MNNTAQTHTAEPVSAFAQVTGSASVEKPELGELLGAGICDFCGETAPQLRVFNRAPAVGLCYCRKCAPTSETEEDWPNQSL